MMKARPRKSQKLKMAKDKMGKKVKVRGEMMKGKDEMKIYDVILANAG